MTPEQQIKALAELDGWTDLTISRPFNTLCGRWMGQLPSKVPNYHESYDAIIPLIQKQTAEIQSDVSFFLPDEVNGFTATPAQLCEALLRATGKWIE